eukprot:gene22796-29965_t
MGMPTYDAIFGFTPFAEQWKADEMGMPTYDGIFGFTPFAEQFVGRFAMLGFASSVVGEFKTGQGALGQIGIETPSTTVLIALLTIAVGATIVGTVVTGKKALDSSMSKSEASRYKNFLRLNVGEDADGEAVKMKKKGDFATPGDDLNAIAASKASGAPVDAFLSTGEVSEGDAAASTTPGDDLSAIAASKASGALVDAFLSTGEVSEGDAAASSTPGDDLSAIAASKASCAPVDAFLSTGEVSEGDAAASTGEVSEGEAAARDMKGEEGSSARPSETSTQRDMYPGEANDTAFAPHLLILLILLILIILITNRSGT